MTRLAKAMSAFTNGRSGSADGRDARSFAGRGASLRVNGSGAPSAATSGRPPAFPAALGALLAAALLSLGLAPAALANGTVDVTVTGTGSGTVTSTSQTIGFSGPEGSAVAVPGEIDCDKAGGPICSATFTSAGFFPNVRVTLVATPDPAGGPFLGWIQNGATAVFAGCAYPAGSPETCAVNLNGNPGPTSNVIAVFGDPPPAPTVTTGDSAPGADFSLVTLEGTVDPGGFAVTNCYFEYGRTASYGNTVPCEQSEAEIGDGEGPVPVSASTEPLEPGTAYHYRLVASSEVADGIGDTSAGQNQTFTTGLAPDSGCPNEDRRHEQGIAALLLPDCMALEMVSPPKKGNQYATLPSVAPGGERIRYFSTGVLGDPPIQPDVWSRYVASRGSLNWGSKAAVPSDPDLNDGKEGGKGNIFSPDFSRWFHFASASDQRSRSIATIYRGGLGVAMSPLSPLLVPIDSGTHSGGNLADARLQGASADHSHFYFALGDIGTAYLPGDPEPAGGAAVANGYIALLDPVGQPSLELLARDGSGQVWGGNCGAAIGGTAQLAAGIGDRNQGAVSADGSRAYFTTRPSQPPTGDCNSANRLRILKRVETQAGAWITPLLASECVETPIACDGTAGGDDLYQGASVDGSKVYFTSNRQLADSDSDATTDLYLFDSSMPVGERLIQASAGNEAAKVLTGIPAISGDGSHAYFTAEGALTGDPNPEGAVAQPGQRNLYVYQRDEDHPDGRLAFIATVSPADIGFAQAKATFRDQAYPVPATGKDASGHEVGGSGHILVFPSEASLTADDTDGGFRDIFRYNAKNSTLERVSVAAPGGEENGAFDVQLLGEVNIGFDRPEAFGGTDFAEEGRWVSEDGETVAFKTAEGLAPGDRNGVMDSYLVRGGQIYRLPGTTDRLAGTFSAGRLQDRPTLSHDGSTVAFTSWEQLLPSDGDSAIDVYALRVNGGYPFEQEPAVCRGEDCQGPAAGAPAAAGANSTTAPPEGIVRTPGNRCRAVARRAQQLSQRAKNLRRNAKRVRAAGKARQMNRQARRVAKRAQRLSANAKRCRRANRGAVR